MARKNDNHEKSGSSVLDSIDPSQAENRPEAETLDPSVTPRSAEYGVDEQGNIRESKAFQTRDRQMQMERAEDSREFTETRELTDEEFIRRFGEESGGALMPRLPEKPGWHFVWALQNINAPSGSWRYYSTLGYRFAEVSDVPGFYHENIKSEGDLNGKIGHNELVLMMISEHRYQLAMKIVGHDKPHEMTKGIMEEAEKKLNYRDKTLVTDIQDGNQRMVKARPSKRFE